jgi:hypothetical protein
LTLKKTQFIIGFTKTGISIFVLSASTLIKDAEAEIGIP